MCTSQSHTHCTKMKSAAFRFMDDYNKHTSMVWPDPYLVPSLCDSRIEQTIHGFVAQSADPCFEQSMDCYRSVVCAQHIHVLEMPILCQGYSNNPIGVGIDLIPQ